MSLSLSTAGAKAGHRRPKKGVSKPSQDIRTGPPAIFRLHNDILWRIFSLNTFTDADFVKGPSLYEQPIIVARHASQVCSCWRALILASSSLWANTITLRFLDQKKDDWRNEILRRTGNSTLSVEGKVVAGRPATEFFLSLLGNHWTRLRRISILVLNGGTTNDERWLALRRPAPNLEICRIAFDSPPAFSTANDLLFANDAPLLHSLITDRINFNLSGSWLSHIRHLRWSSSFVASMFIHALVEMPFLETLQTHETNDENTDDVDAENDQWPMVRLPRLNCLSLSLKFRTYIILLRHIVPTPGCTYSLESVNDAGPVLSAREISLLEQGLTDHFRCFYDLSGCKTIYLSMTDRIFSMTNVLHQELFAEFLNPSSFYAHLKGDRGSHIPLTIITSLGSCDLSSVKTLDLQIEDATLDPSNSGLIKFCGALTSVETISTDSGTIELLLKIQKLVDWTILFPSLQTIAFATDGKLKSDVIIRFLNQRRDAGVPIKLFNLSDCISPGQERLLFLEGIDGLEVVWDEEIRSEM